MNNNWTAGSSSPSALLPPWIELPREVTVNILRRLGPVEMMDTAENVCTTWQSACREPSLWRVFDMKSCVNLRTLNHAHSVFRRAVDRSQGELIDINIRHFVTNDLLRYVSERSGSLKILSLEYSRDSCGKGLRKAVKHFPYLEELHLILMPHISAWDIEAIGVSCPMLKSFTFNDGYLNYPFIVKDDTYAMLIGKNMPNLRRLRLIANLMSNEGLIAILDGCPSLELLDLRDCFGVDLECDLGRRCSEQIKELRRPYDGWDGLDERIYDPDVESKEVWNYFWGRCSHLWPTHQCYNSDSDYEGLE